jgi:tetratricopeptide (TPR) repeat protein
MRTALAFRFLRSLWLVPCLFRLFCLAALADEFEAGLSRAEAYVRQGDLKKAEQELLTLAKSNPMSFVVHNNLGTIYMQQQRYQVACREFAMAAELNPKLADSQRNLGTCLFQIDELAKAVEPLERAKRLDPKDLRTRYLLGYSLLMLNRVDGAQEELEYVRRYKPGDEQTLFSLVKVYQRKQDQQRAGTAFRELQSAHPNSVFVHILMGESYDLQERRDQARAEFRKAIELAPTMPRLHFDLGFLFWSDGQFEEAEKEFKAELSANPHFSPAAYYLGDIAFNQNDYPKALEFFTNAAGGDCGCLCLDAFVGLGKTYFRLDRLNESLKHLEKARRLDADQPDVQYWLAMVYRRLGDSAQSSQALERHQLLMNKTKEAGAARALGLRRWVTEDCLSKSN